MLNCYVPYMPDVSLQSTIAVNYDVGVCLSFGRFFASGLFESIFFVAIIVFQTKIKFLSCKYRIFAGNRFYFNTNSLASKILAHYNGTFEASDNF